MNVDFTKPMAVTTLAKLAKIDPVNLHGRAKRAACGLVDEPPPRRGGRFAWVTGPSAATFLAESLALSAALFPK